MKDFYDDFLLYNARYFGVSYAQKTLCRVKFAG